jgi:prevent-host-death family protein
MKWQLQEAKQKFSQVVQRAIDEGPQEVTRHGEKVVVIISAAEYRRLTEKKTSFLEFLMSGPDLSILDLSRDKRLPREIDL